MGDITSNKLKFQLVKLNELKLKLVLVRLQHVLHRILQPACHAPHCSHLEKMSETNVTPLHFSLDQRVNGIITSCGHALCSLVCL